MGNRIRELRKHLGLTQQEFADRIGVKQNTLSQYESGRNDPIDAVVSLICREFGISEAWLRTGEGEMIAPSTRQEEIAKYVGELFASKPDPFKERFILMLLRLPPSGWDWLREQAAALLAEDEEK